MKLKEFPVFWKLRGGGPWRRACHNFWLSWPNPENEKKARGINLVCFIYQAPASITKSPTDAISTNKYSRMESLFKLNSEGKESEPVLLEEEQPQDPRYDPTQDPTQTQPRTHQDPLSMLYRPRRSSKQVCFPKKYKICKTFQVRQMKKLFCFYYTRQQCFALDK